MLYQNMTFQWQVWFDGLSYTILQPGQSMILTGEEQLLDIHNDIEGAEFGCYLSFIVNEVEMSTGFEFDRFQ